MDYTVQLEALAEQLATMNDMFQVVCGILGFIAGLLLILIFTCAWRS